MTAPRADRQWRTPTERAELVERLIAAEGRNRLLEQALRDLAAHHEGDPANGSYITALLARIAGLERNVDHLTRRRSA